MTIQTYGWLLLLGFVSLGARAQTPLVSIEASRYDMSFVNISKHHLHIIMTDRALAKAQAFALEPSRQQQFTGQYGRQRLQELEVMYSYDLATFRADLAQMQAQILAFNRPQADSIRALPWFQYVTSVAQDDYDPAYWEGYDLTQKTLGDRNVSQLAADIHAKLLADKATFGQLDTLIVTDEQDALASVIAVLELAYRAQGLGYREQVGFLKNCLVMLSDRNFVQRSRDLVYNMADGLDLSTTTPRYIVGLAPILFTENLTETWLAPNETGLDTEKLLSEGWLNRTAALYAARAITNEWRLGRSGVIYGRVYARLQYERLGYRLNPFGIYYVGEQYVTPAPNATATEYEITVNEGIFLELSHWSAGAQARLMIGRHVALDLEGGLLTRMGRLRFWNGADHFATNNDVADFVHRNRTRVTERAFAPYVRTELSVGISQRKGRGLFLTMGYDSFQSFLTPNEDFAFLRKTLDGTHTTPLNADTWKSGLRFGVAYSF